MAWDYLKAIGNDRAMRVGVSDAVNLSDQVKPPSLGPNDKPAWSGEGSTGELVRLYGRSQK